jgi:hypothetical protein
MSSSRRASAELDLAQLFGSVAQSLSGSQERLNGMDGYNGDHGTNMFTIFQTAADALSKQQGKSPEKALGYAANQVRKLPSGSAQVYATGFEDAAARFKGQSTLGANDVSNLLTTLLGLGGAEQAALQPAQPAPQANPLAALLGSLTGGTTESAATEEDTLLENIFEGGLAFLQAKQEGQDDMGAGLQALIAASPLGEVPHRQESASLVVTGLLNALPGLLGQQ